MIKCSKFLRCVLVFLMLACFLLAIMPSPRAHADALTAIAITGSIAMTIGVLSQLGVLSLDAANMRPAAVAAASAVGSSLQDYVHDRLSTYLAYASIPVAMALRIASQGAMYYQDGSISFNEGLSNLLSGFMDWLWDEDGGNLQEYNPSIGSSGQLQPNVDYSQYMTDLGLSTLYGANKVYTLRTDGSVSYEFSSDNPDVVFGFYQIPNASYQIMAVSPTAATVTRYYQGQVDSTSTLSRRSYNGVSFYADLTLPWTWTVSNPPVFSPPVNHMSNNDRNKLAMLLLTSSQIGSDLVTNPDVLYLPDNTDINILSPGESLNDILIYPDAGITVNIADYLTGLVEGLERGYTDFAGTYEEAGEVVDTVVSTDVAIDEALTVTQSLASDLPIAGDGVAESVDTSDLAPFTMDLRDFFPFCIPFDIYDMLSMLQAARQAPVINWRFYIPTVCDEVVTLDFEAFDQAAEVLRTMELLAFAIGLAVNTKKLIQGGD